MGRRQVVRDDSQTVGLGQDVLCVTGSKRGIRRRKEVVAQDGEVKVQANVGTQDRKEVRNKAGRT